MCRSPACAMQSGWLCSCSHYHRGRAGSLPTSADGMGLTAVVTILQLPRPARPAGRLARMNPSDFAGLYWYKLLIPCFTWGSIIGTFLGPLLFPTAWFLFVAAFMIVFVLVSLCQVRYLRAVSSCMHALHAHCATQQRMSQHPASFRGSGAYLWAPQPWQQAVADRSPGMAGVRS